MKLLPLACFAASAAQSGDYDYGAVDAGDDDRHYGYNSYGDYDSHGHSGGTNWAFGAKALGAGSIAIALNCWPANFDTDTLMMRDDQNMNPKENHPYGPLHVYGSEKHSYYADMNSQNSFDTEDPGLRAGMGGHYHYGHAHSADTWNSAPSTWVHYHSARHAGCLYEIPNFTYNSATWDKQWHLWYYNGYYDTGNKGSFVPATTDLQAGMSAIYDPNWVHFFNAHVLPTASFPMSTDPNAQDPSPGGNSIKLVIANPQYEGLGWLNFVATYGRRGFVVGESYKEFADSTHVTSTTAALAGFDTYTQINSSPAQQTEGTTGNYYYDAWMGTWELSVEDTDTWVTLYDESAGSTFSPNHSDAGIAVSSFPHNELGKDFRFNLRVLLCDSANTNRKMYYFYKINTITIEFPHYVTYALHYDGREDNTDPHNTMDGGTNGGGGNAQGDGLYNVAQNNDRDNIIPPLDLGSWRDSSFGMHDVSPNDHHRITGYLSTQSGDFCSTGDSDCADFCRTPSTDCGINDLQCTAENLEEVCSKYFHITGLLNTYSERLGGQRGTYQEIWVQLQYAMAQGSINSNPDIGGTNDIISSPFPYLHFMSYEIMDISFMCDTTNVDNGNTCNPFQAYDTHDFGWGGK
jgi:hypothetical protein